MPTRCPRSAPRSAFLREVPLAEGHVQLTRMPVRAHDLGRVREGVRLEQRSFAHGGDRRVRHRAGRAHRARAGHPPQCQLAAGIRRRPRGAGSARGARPSRGPAEPRDREPEPPRPAPLPAAAVGPPRRTPPPRGGRPPGRAGPRPGRAGRGGHRGPGRGLGGPGRPVPPRGRDRDQDGQGRDPAAARRPGAPRGPPGRARAADARGGPQGRPAFRRAGHRLPRTRPAAGRAPAARRPAPGGPGAAWPG